MDRAGKKSAADKLFLISFALILTFAIAFRIYKALHSGIIYDESFTFSYFGRSIHKALTSYINPNNNHVLNSIFICLDYKIFGGREYFIRLHSIVFAAIFCLSTAYIVHKTIRSRALQIMFLAIVLLNWFAFDLSFLASGYSIALAAVQSGLAAIIAMQNKKIKYTSLWLPIITVVLMNFFAFGSMLSCIGTLLGINFTFIIFYSSCVFQNPPDKRRATLINLVSIPPLTAFSLYLLYMNLYKDILAGRGRFGTAPFSKHIRDTLIGTMVSKGTVYNTVVYWLFVCMVGLALLFLLCRLGLKIKESGWLKNLSLNDSGIFMPLVTIFSILAIFAQRTVFGISLGAPRNSVFIVPLVLISAGILLDRLHEQLKNTPPLGPVILVIIITVSSLFMLQNLPSAYAVRVHDWDRQSVSGPLLRQLKKIDPKKTWKISLSDKTMYLTWPLFYYQNFGYNFKITSGQDCDIAALYETEKLPRLTYFKEDYFRKFNCYFAVNPGNAPSLMDSD